LRQVTLLCWLLCALTWRCCEGSQSANRPAKPPAALRMPREFADLCTMRIPLRRSERLLPVTHIHTMSPLNRTAASRLFAVASRPAFSRQAPRFASNQSFVAPNSAEVDNIQSREEPPSPVHLTKGETKGSEPAVQNTPSHAPNYGAAVDYRTSAFSPVPKRVMDGSEPTETVAAAVVSGAPTDLQARTVRFVNSRLRCLLEDSFVLTH